MAPVDHSLVTPGDLSSESGPREAGGHGLWLLGAGATLLAAIVALWPSMTAWRSELYAASHGSALTITGFTIGATTLIIGASALVASLGQPRLGVTSSDRSDRETETPPVHRAAGVMSSADWILLAPSHVAAGIDESLETDREATAASAEGAHAVHGPGPN